MWQELTKTNIKRCKITCRFELDSGLGTTGSAVEFNSTRDQQFLIHLLQIYFS